MRPLRELADRGLNAVRSGWRQLAERLERESRAPPRRGMPDIILYGALVLTILLPGMLLVGGIAVSSPENFAAVVGILLGGGLILLFVVGAVLGILAAIKYLKTPRAAEGLYVTCPECRLGFVIPPAWRENRVRCRGCGHIFPAKQGIRP